MNRCGTYAGWNRHVYHGEKPCPECLSAQRDYARNRRRRNGESRSVLVPIVLITQAARQCDAPTSAALIGCLKGRRATA